ncbi:MAG: carboxymuconolactone decarboxylase family protein [Candidatus Bathyarchaeota archaeon]|nr:MAG: carboxymuconolactone decarboxylase family protein [Candidatus Bathyarchaeota archaeon]
MRRALFDSARKSSQGLLRACNKQWFISVGILTGLEVNNISEGDPLKILRDVDPEFLKVFTDTENLAFSEGALTAKTKTLVAMAIDATHGSVQGVVALAQEAIEIGATKEEIIEALRVAYYIGGAGAIYTAAYALQTIFPSNK